MSGFFYEAKWPVRLSVRTLGFQPRKRGSTPLRATKAFYLPVSKGISCTKTTESTTTHQGAVRFDGLVYSCQECSWKVSL